MGDDNFKVIIVGGGPVGLIAAHVLLRAGIDFVLLESRPDICINLGASLVLLPSGQRMLGQLGLLDVVCDFSTPLGKVQRYDHQGNDIGDSHFFVRMKENHGLAPRVITRSDLASLLCTTLPSGMPSAAQYPGKKVTSVTTTPDAITAHCADGTAFTGTLLVGADGAHSLVRSFITSTSQPFLTTFRCLYIRFPTPDSGLFPPGTATETHGPGCAVQAFSGATTCAAGLYERLPFPTPEAARYSAEDEAGVVRKWGHLPICPGLTVEDAYAARVEAGLVALEEGVVETWVGERAVLVGDAAHKFTPSTGAGWNTGAEDVFVLVNELVRLRGRGGRAMGVEELRKVGRVYQKTRFAAVQADCALAGRMTQLAAWRSGVVGLLDLWVMGSGRVQRFLIDKSAEAVARTAQLKFTNLGGRPEIKMEGGRVPWAE